MLEVNNTYWYHSLPPNISGVSNQEKYPMHQIDGLEIRYKIYMPSVSTGHVQVEAVVIV